MIPLLLLLVFWLGAHSLNTDTIWYDEWWSVFYSGSAPQYSPADLTTTIQRVAETEHELNPPGYYLALNVWGRLAGDTPFALRAWSLLLGMLALAWDSSAKARRNGSSRSAVCSRRQGWKPSLKAGAGSAWKTMFSSPMAAARC